MKINFNFAFMSHLMVFSDLTILRIFEGFLQIEVIVWLKLFLFFLHVDLNV